MMRSRRQILRRYLRRFAKSERGVAALEFAMVLPVLAIMFLATFDGGRGIAVYMKVRAATYTLAAITNQYSTIHDADMSEIFNVTTKVLAPYSTGPLALTVSQITIDANGRPTVSWSNTQGGTARAVGSPVTLPTNLATPSSFLLLSEVKYSYAPLFGFFNNGGTINLSDSIDVTPRISNSITRVSP
jgi:Flp pilus assembly protein TadG